jgi:hypothetical protein
VVRSRARRHEDPPLHELVISKLGLPEGEVLGHGEQARFALRGVDTGSAVMGHLLG